MDRSWTTVKFTSSVLSYPITSASSTVFIFNTIPRCCRRTTLLDSFKGRIYLRLKYWPYKFIRLRSTADVDDLYRFKKDVFRGRDFQPFNFHFRTISRGSRGQNCFVFGSYSQTYRPLQLLTMYNNFWEEIQKHHIFIFNLILGCRW